ncbi:hypothetical protein HDU92_001029 [Lobulomyces angularis]|nr:hypothetical protein HDU92_001029 [Lobulomyces angularis]
MDRVKNNRNFAKSLYQDSEILQLISSSKLYDEDFKSFVDKPLKTDEETVLKNFEELKSRTNNNITQSDLVLFLEENFKQCGHDFVDAELLDFRKNITLFNKIKNKMRNTDGKYEKVLYLSEVLHNSWAGLSRKFENEFNKDDILNYEHNNSSSIYVDHHFIIPGGRFRETYYWDTLFIIEGLLVSELYDTVKGMLLNFLSVIDTYGFFPNGLRIYYLNRSQPPVLCLMFEKYFEKKGYETEEDIALLKKALPILEKEYNWWMKNRSHEVKKGEFLNLYKAENLLPRPEMYPDDLSLIKKANVESEEEKINIYKNLASACESGWDFSSRWIYDYEEKKCSETSVPSEQTECLLSKLETDKILPVDLNTLMLINERIISKFYDILNNKVDPRKFNAVMESQQYKVKSSHFQEQSLLREKLILEFFFCLEDESYFDYHIIHKQLIKRFNLGSFWPLWAEIGFSEPNKDLRYKYMFAPFKNMEKFVASNPGGLPTTLTKDTAQQWDYPNAWPPLQYTTMLSMVSVINKITTSQSNADQANSLNNDQLFHFNDAELSMVDIKSSLRTSLKNLTQIYINSLYIGHRKSGFFHEKFNCEIAGESGGGGEYLPQVGFGWTNGIGLWVIDNFLDTLEDPDYNE